MPGVVVEGLVGSGVSLGGDVVDSLFAFVRSESCDWDRLEDWCWLSSGRLDCRCGALCVCRSLRVIVSVAILRIVSHTLLSFFEKYNFFDERNTFLTAKIYLQVMTPQLDFFVLMTPGSVSLGEDPLAVLPSASGVVVDFSEQKHTNVHDGTTI